MWQVFAYPFTSRIGTFPRGPHAASARCGRLMTRMVMVVLLILGLGVAAQASQESPRTSVANPGSEAPKARCQMRQQGVRM